MTKVFLTSAALSVYLRRDKKHAVFNVQQIIIFLIQLFAKSRAYRMRLPIYQEEIINNFTIEVFVEADLTYQCVNLDN